MKEGKKSSMTEEKVKDLDDMGFFWTVPKDKKSPTPGASDEDGNDSADDHGDRANYKSGSVSPPAE
jgi:hypothetical protein